MVNLLVNHRLTDVERRQLIFGGDILLYSSSEATNTLVRHCREIIAETFGELDPERAQYSLAVEEFVSLVGPLKSRFTNDPASSELVRRILDETARTGEFPGNVDETDGSRKPNRASLADDPQARVAQGRAVENKFIQQKKQREGDRHLLGVESQHVQDADGDRMGVSGCWGGRVGSRDLQRVDERHGGTRYRDWRDEDTHGVHAARWLLG